MIAELLGDLNKDGAVAFNLHLTGHCNMNCRGCYARFGTAEGRVNHGTPLTRQNWEQIIDTLAEETSEIERKKMNFVGGEPLLIKYLPELLALAKDRGFTTSIVTNGALLTRQLDELAPHTDWIGISIDSFASNTLRQIGRHVRGRTVDYSLLGKAVRDHGIRLKVNTVISKANWSEDLSDGLRGLNPDRWKVFRFLVIWGENDRAADLSVSDTHFQDFVTRHMPLRPVVEDNHQMRGSYLMIGPNGELLDNSRGAYHPVANLLTGVQRFQQTIHTGFSPQGFRARGAIYDW